MKHSATIPTMNTNNSLAIKKVPNTAKQVKTITTSKGVKYSLSKEQGRALTQFFDSFQSAVECFKYIDTAKKGHILGVDWTTAL